jgi:enamine deaminase RidA (YjgF/YER057c/UK114 family)
MADTVEDRLHALGISLAEAPAPVANYVPWVVAGPLLFVSGQLPLLDGVVLHPGTVGADVSIEEAQAAARQCAVNLIAQARAACRGELERIGRVVKLGGFVACGAGFTDHPKVINGASDLMVEVFAEAGRHARSAVGAPSLPLGACVEVDAVFEVG